MNIISRVVVTFPQKAKQVEYVLQSTDCENLAGFFLAPPDLAFDDNDGKLCIGKAEHEKMIVTVKVDGTETLQDLPASLFAAKHLQQSNKDFYAAPKSASKLTFTFANKGGDFEKDALINLYFVYR
jgi:hypothetical protein